MNDRQAPFLFSIVSPRCLGAFQPISIDRTMLKRGEKPNARYAMFWRDLSLQLGKPPGIVRVSGGLVHVFEYVNMFS
jgi:hypothetical protein